MSQQPNAELAIEALKQAIQKQQPDTTQLLFHSDQGVQYSANCFVDYLDTDIDQLNFKNNHFYLSDF